MRTYETDRLLVTVMLVFFCVILGGTIAGKIHEALLEAATPPQTISKDCAP